MRSMVQIKDYCISRQSRDYEYIHYRLEQSRNPEQKEYG
jgi:hypothetical protein